MNSLTKPLSLSVVKPVRFVGSGSWVQTAPVDIAARDCFASASRLIFLIFMQPELILRTLYLSRLYLFMPVQVLELDCNSNVIFTTGLLKYVVSFVVPFNLCICYRFVFQDIKLCNCF